MKLTDNTALTSLKPVRFATVVLCLYLMTSTSPVIHAQTSGQAQSVTTVSVQPFTNVTAIDAYDWVGLGIAATVTASFETLEDFRVARAPATTTSTSSSDLNITGTYQVSNRSMRITARITHRGTGRVLASVIADGTVDELFELQDRLVTELHNSLRLTRDGAQPNGLSARDTVDNQPTAPTADPAQMDDRALVSIDGPAPPVAPQTMSRDDAGRTTIRAVSLDEILTIDGRLSEPVYESVIPVSNFIQQVPNEGMPATEQTDAWVLFDADNIYVSARLFDSSPESNWVANEMQRDSFQLIFNDSFSATFDTYYDRRNGVGFLVNPIGGMFDLEITDEGNPNPDWNPIWEVQTGRFEGGWTVEMQIPFKSLRYEASTEQVWGIQLSRTVQWKNEESYITRIPISAGPGVFRLSAAGTLTGLEVPGDNRTLEIKPYAIGSLATDRLASPAISNQAAGDFGVDLKYGVTQNLTADFTYNTDFAQVEVDEQQVNLTRFNLFFPEKREFFLEGRGIFDFGKGARRITGAIPALRPGAGGFMGGGDVPTVFFSRRIGLDQGNTVPILAGGRLNGKVGKFSIGEIGRASCRERV